MQTFCGDVCSPSFPAAGAPILYLPIAVKTRPSTQHNVFITIPSAIKQARTGLVKGSGFAATEMISPAESSPVAGYHPPQACDLDPLVCHLQAVSECCITPISAKILLSKKVLDNEVPVDIHGLRSP